MNKAFLAACFVFFLSTGSVAQADYDLQPVYWGSVGYFEPFDYYVVAVDVAPNGNVHLVDLFHENIRIVQPDGSTVNEFPIVDTWPRGIAADALGNSYVADTVGAKIRKYSPTGEVLLAFGSDGNMPGQFDYPVSIQINSEGELIVVDRVTQLTAFDTDGNVIWNNMATAVSAADLGKPLGVALDAQDNIFVVDAQSDRVVVFDSNGMYLRDWGPAGPGWQLQAPVSVTIGNNGNVYVLDRLQQLSDIGKDQVFVFDPQGNFIRSFGKKGRQPYDLWEPQGISTGLDGSIWVGGFQGHNVVRYDEDGVPIDEWNDHDPTPYEFAQARGAAVGNGGRLYAIDFWNHLVQVFDRYGNFEEMWGERGQGNGQVFNFPKHSTTDSFGNLYISDDDQIRKFTPDGQFLMRVTPGVQKFPGGLEVDTSGKLWVTVSSDSSIVRYNSSFQPDLVVDGAGFPGGLNSPRNIRQAPNGLMYFADSFNHRIIRMDQSGSFDLEWGSIGTGAGQFLSPVGLAIDSENRVYVSETWASRTQVFSADGDFLAEWDLPGIPGKDDATVFELALDGDYFLYAPDHTDGQAEVHKYALIPAVDVNGEPVLPGSELAASIWSDDGQLWHLRWEADGVNREFSGRIHSTSGLAQVWAPSTIPVAASIAQVNEEMAMFSALHASDVSGVDVLVSGPGIVTFELDVDGESRPEIIQVGATGFVPNSLPLPFETSGGLSLIDPLGRPDYTGGEDAGYFLWRDENDGSWYLWWSGDGIVTSQFSGTVSSTHVFNEVAMLDFEPNDSLSELPYEFSFVAPAGAGQDGVAFSVQDGATLTFDLQIDGVDDTQRVFIGSSGLNPDGIPFSMISLPVDLSPDTDGDSIVDLEDNCTEVSNISQCDTDQDGYGNACDGDLNGSGMVDFLDLALVRESFFAADGDPSFNADADLNCDLAVNFSDLQLFQSLMFLPPGPSGVL